MVFRVQMFNYFFGSDLRSVQYLDIVNQNNNYLQVITLPHKISGRGRKLNPNPVEKFCIKNNIHFEYYDPNTVYEYMSTGICVSFGRIFSETFLMKNKPIYNIHLSLLPSYRGPSPVEFSILNEEKIVGFSVFEINNKIDDGKIVFQESFSIDSDTYASDIYDTIISLFDNKYKQISENLTPEKCKNEYKLSYTKKFIKNDYNILKYDVLTAKKMIRAFDVIGPAFLSYDEQIFKIQQNTKKKHAFPIELTDGILYPSIITPQGKSKMRIEDYLRGNL